MTNKDLVNFCKEAANLSTVYMWGAFGNDVTESFINQKKNQYPKRYPKWRIDELTEHIGKSKGCDCVGLIKWAMWTDGDISKKPKYDTSTDRSTNMLYNAAKEKGSISSMPDIPGIVVYQTGHVGVYVGDNMVIECALDEFTDGVKEQSLTAHDWTHWLKVPEIEYESPAEKSIDEVALQVINGDYGNGTTRKKKLAAEGWNYNEVQARVNELLGITNDYQKMTVIPSVGLWLNNNSNYWNDSTHIVCMPEGATVRVYRGTEKKLGIYTCVKVKYNNTIGFCAKEYLK